MVCVFLGQVCPALLTLAQGRSSSSLSWGGGGDVVLAAMTMSKAVLLFIQWGRFLPAGKQY